MSVDGRTCRETRWVGRFAAPVLAVYALSLIGIAVHFSLIDHTIDTSTGQAVGLHGHYHGDAPASGDRIGATATDVHSGPSRCHFAEHLAGQAAIDGHGSGETGTLHAASSKAHPTTTVRPGGPLLLCAPKHSPPA